MNYTRTAAGTYRPQSGAFQMLIAIEGQGLVADEETRAGEAWYVPPDTPAFDITGNLTLLETSANPPQK